MENTIYTPIIKKLLAKGEGIKVGLFDNRSKSIFSNLIPHSVFLEFNFFLLDFLQNTTRTKMSNVHCSIFISSNSIDQLVLELNNPYYESYSIFFLNAVGEDDINRISAADALCVVRDVYETYIDLFNIDSNLFTLNQNFESGIDDLEVSAIKIASLVMTIESMPQLIYTKNTSNLANKLKDRLEKINIPFKNEESASLLVLDRSFDMITPLLYEWRYQSMIYEYLNYQNGIVTFCEDNEYDKRKGKSFSLYNDTFFDVHKFDEISKISNALKSLTIPKRRNWFDNPQNLAETHLTIHNFILKDCIKNAKISEAEYQCLNNSPKLELLKDKTIDLSARVKLLIIYLYSIGFNFNQSIENLLQDKRIAQYPEYIDYILAYRNYQIKIVQLKNPTSPDYKFVPDKDVKIGYVPPILRITRRFIENRLPKSDFMSFENANQTKIKIIYVRGGLTYSEYCAIRVQYKNIIVLTDFMFGYKDIFKEVLKKSE